MTPTLSLGLPKHDVMVCGGAEVHLHSFLTSTLASRSGRFTPVPTAPVPTGQETGSATVPVGRGATRANDISGSTEGEKRDVAF
jgi:hypothetical protein